MLIEIKMISVTTIKLIIIMILTSWYLFETKCHGIIIILTIYLSVFSRYLIIFSSIYSLAKYSHDLVSLKFGNFTITAFLPFLQSLSSSSIIVPVIL